MLCCSLKRSHPSIFPSFLQSMAYYSTLPGDPAFPRQAAKQLENSGLEILETDSAQRGLFTTKRIGYSKTIFTESPMTCHPALSSLDRVCYHCLKGLLNGNLTSKMSTNKHVRFCSQNCLDEAKDSYMEVESDDRFLAFDEICEEHNLRFPLMIKRLTCTSMQKGNFSIIQDLGFLSYGKMQTLPGILQQCAALLYSGCQKYVKASQNSKMASQVDEVSMGFFMALYARLALNTIRVDGILPGPEFKSEGDSETSRSLSLFQNQITTGILGSGLYLTASMFNHSCCPNVGIASPSNNGQLSFLAERDIEAGEQLFISYLDPNHHRKERQEHLKANYGFTCSCELCLEQE